MFNKAVGDIAAGDIDVQKMQDLMLGGGYTSNHTQDGHTMTRKGAGGNPIALDMFGINQHVQQVVYDLEMGDAVYDAYRTLHHPKTKQAFADAGRNDVWENVDLWLGDVITGEIHRGSGLEKMLRHVRTGTTISRLAWNMTTAALQPLGLLQSSTQIGKANTMLGLFDLVHSEEGGRTPWAAYKYVTEQSGFMAEREQSFNKDIHDAQRNLRAGLVSTYAGKPGELVLDSFFYFIAKAQRFVDVVTWMGAKRQGMKMFDGDTAKATTHADRMVARTQGSGNFHERTNFERGTISKSVRNTEVVRNWSMFLSYFAAKVNVTYERTAKMKKNWRANPLEIIDYAVDMGLLFMVEGVAAGILRNGMDDDDENNWEELGMMAVKESLNSYTAGLPLVREIATAAAGFDTGGAIGGFASNLTKMAQQVGQGEMDAQLARSSMNVIGVVLKLPSSQPFKTTEALLQDWDMYDEASWWEYLSGVKKEY